MGTTIFNINAVTICTLSVVHVQCQLQEVQHQFEHPGNVVSTWGQPNRCMRQHTDNTHARRRHIWPSTRFGFRRALHSVHTRPKKVRDAQFNHLLSKRIARRPGDSLM